MKKMLLAAFAAVMLSGCELMDPDLWCGDDPYCDDSFADAAKPASPPSIAADTAR